jgi:hypothetical protein
MLMPIDLRNKSESLGIPFETKNDGPLRITDFKTSLIVPEQWAEILYQLEGLNELFKDFYTDLRGNFGYCESCIEEMKKKSYWLQKISELNRIIYFIDDFLNVQKSTDSMEIE